MTKSLMFRLIVEVCEQPTQAHPTYPNLRAPELAGKQLLAGK
jgi:hypothetical protein